MVCPQRIQKITLEKFITKSDASFYKVQQLNLLQSAAAIYLLFTNCKKLSRTGVKKWDDYNVQVRKVRKQGVLKKRQGFFD